MIEIQPLPAMLREMATSSPGTILIQHTDGKTETCGSFWEKCRRWAGGIHAFCTTPSGAVVTMLHNSVESYLVWVGASLSGKIEVATSPTQRGAALAHVLNTTSAELAVVHGPSQLEALIEIQGSLADLHTVIMLTGEPNRNSRFRVISVSEFLDAGNLSSIQSVASHEIATIIFTSGTTGQPKGVLVSWARFENATAQYFPDCREGHHSNGAYYQVWPTHHGSGKLGLVIAVTLGLRLVIRQRFSVTHFWTDVHKYGVTHTLLILVANYLMSDPDWTQNSSNTLEHVTMAPLIPDFRTFEDRFGVRVATGYGQSEIGFALSAGAPANHQTVGRASPGYQIQLVDEFDYPVAEGDAGELVVRHEEPWQLNQGYVNMPEATVAAWRNGWFHTGDVFRQDSDGNLYFVDRVQDYIRTKGENISSFELESIVNTHKEISESACIGVPSGRTGERNRLADEDVKIVAVRTKGSALSEDQLAEFIDSRAPHHMRPRFIEFRASLPRTDTNKVQKAVIRNEGNGPSTWERPEASRSISTNLFHQLATTKQNHS